MMKRTRLAKGSFGSLRKGRLSHLTAFNEQKSKDINRFVSHAEREIDRFDRTSDITHLQQAGNKLYNAHNYFVEKTIGDELRDRKDLILSGRQMSDINPVFKQIRRNVFAFHKWFYEGVEDAREARDMMKETVHLMKGMMVGG